MRLELELIRKSVETWKETAIEYFETLQRGIVAYGDDDLRGKELSRVASTFASFCSARGLDRIMAHPGDPLVDGLFQVVDEEISTEVLADTILYCKEWGYRSATKVYKRAKIVLAKHKEQESVGVE